MTHIQLQNRFKQKLEQYLNVYFYYKIPDTVGMGGLRPFDSILIYKGTAYGIEFKVGRDTLKKHQLYYLDLVTRSGGESLVITDKDVIDRVIQTRILKKTT